MVQSGWILPGSFLGTRCRGWVGDGLSHFGSGLASWHDTQSSARPRPDRRCCLTYRVVGRRCPTPSFGVVAEGTPHGGRISFSFGAEPTS